MNVERPPVVWREGHAHNVAPDVYCVVEAVTQLLHLVIVRSVTHDTAL